MNIYLNTNKHRNEQPRKVYEVSDIIQLGQNTAPVCVVKKAKGSECIAEHVDDVQPHRQVNGTSNPRVVKQLVHSLASGPTLDHNRCDLMEKKTNKK